MGPGEGFWEMSNWIGKLHSNCDRILEQLLVNSEQGGFPIHRQAGSFFRETCHAERQDPIDDAIDHDVGERDDVVRGSGGGAVGALR